MIEWTGIRQIPAVHTWSSNALADEYFARMIRAKDAKGRERWATLLDEAQRKET